MIPEARIAGSTKRPRLWPRIRARLPDSFETAAALLLVVAVIVTPIALVRDCRERARCTGNGGHYERVRCRPYEDWNCTTDGAGGTSCSFDSGERCDEVCVGASAEDGR